MKMYKTISAVLAVTLPAISASAGVIWDGGGASGSTWGTGTNWDLDVAPTFNNTTDLSFPTSGSPNSSAFLGAARTVRSLSFGSGVTSPFATSFRVGTGGSSVNLTLDTSVAGGNASINVASGSTGNITLGAIATESASIANMILSDNLVIDHNGSGNLLINRNIIATGFSITKTGTGRWVQGANNAGTPAAGTIDVNSASSVVLGGGALEILVPSVTPVTKTFIVPLTVSSASTLAYNNQDTADRAFTISTGSMTLNSGLTVQNLSVNPTSNTIFNIVNISRALTGSGSLTTSTLNNLTSNADSYSRQRVQLSGDNSAWSGDLIIAKGSAQLSGNLAQPTGAGAITIGTTADSFGAGLAFNQTTDVILSRNITVRSGGFRGIKSNNLSGVDVTTTPVTGYNIALNGTINLEGDLTVDHSLVNSSTPGPVITASHSMTINGVISGVGGLNVTRVHVADLNRPSSDGSQLVLTGANLYFGTTTIQNRATLALATTGSIDNSSVIDVQSGAMLDVSTKSTAFTVGAGKTFKGNGTIKGNSVINGNLTPGSSAGKLTWSAGNLALGDGVASGAGATSTFEVTGAEGVANAGITYDNVTLSTATQTLTYDGTLNIAFSSAPTVPGTYDFFTFTGSALGGLDAINIAGAPGSLSGTFASAVWTGTINGLSAEFTLSSGDLVLSLSAVPEPLTAAGVLMLAGRVLGRRSRLSIH